MDNGARVSVLVGCCWAVFYLFNAGDVAMPFLGGGLDWTTLAACVLGGLAILAQLRLGMGLRQHADAFADDGPRRGPRARPGGMLTTTRSLPGLVAFVLLSVVGTIELSDLFASASPLARDLVFGIYTAALAIGLAVLGRRSRMSWVVPMGSALSILVSVLALAALCVRVPALVKFAAPVSGALVLALLVLALVVPFAIRSIWHGHDAKRARAFAGASSFALGIAAFTWLSFAVQSASGSGLHMTSAWFNLRFVMALLVMAAITLFVRWNKDTLSDGVRVVLALATTVVAFVAGLLEVLQMAPTMAGGAAGVPVSIYTTLFAAALLTVGFVRGIEALRYGALMMFGIVVLKVGLYDLRATELPLRILVTGVLGLVLLGASFAYAKRERPTSAMDSAT